MEAKELRIGNYLNDREGNLCKVYELGKSSILAPALDKPTTKLPNGPIPLTEEWLLKLGFIKDYGDFCIKLPESDKEIRLIDWTPFEQLNKEWGVSAMTHLSIRIKYAHQIQNLFYSLCGDELTIKQPIEKTF